MLMLLIFMDLSATFFLDVKEEVHDVAVLDDIFLAFGGELSGGSDGTFAAECDEIIVLDDFRPDESLLEVRVDDSGGFRCLVTLVDCPCAALIGSCREECLEPEQMVGSLDQSHDTGFFQPISSRNI